LSEKNISNYLIEPGYIYYPIIQTKISAVLGSCVSVAIYDNRNKTGGMNHFLYPDKKHHDQPRSIFGNISTKALIKMMIKNGSRKKHLEAQIFGGAFNDQISSENIGKKNILTARQILIKENIKITSEDTGGNKGRKVIFDTFTNEIVIIRVDKLRQTDWYPYI
jgi:chemotaxis protein CheD